MPDGGSSPVTSSMILIFEEIPRTLIPHDSCTIRMELCAVVFTAVASSCRSMETQASVATGIISYTRRATFTRTTNKCLSFQTNRSCLGLRSCPERMPHAKEVIISRPVLTRPVIALSVQTKTAHCLIDVGGSLFCGEGELLGETGRAVCANRGTQTGEKLCKIAPMVLVVLIT